MHFSLNVIVIKKHLKPQLLSMMNTNELLPFIFQLPKLTTTPRPAALSSLYARTRWPVSPEAGAVTGRRTVQMARTNRQKSVSVPTWKKLLKLSQQPRVVSFSVLSKPSVWGNEHYYCFYSAFAFLRLLFCKSAFLFKISSQRCCCTWCDKTSNSLPLNGFEETTAQCSDSLIWGWMRG